MAIKFILQAPYEKGKDGKTKTRGENKVPASRETTLYAFMIIDRDHVIKCKTSEKIIPAQWDFKKQGLNDQVTGAIEYNLKLAKIKKDLQDEYDRLRREFPDFTFQQLSERLKEYSKLRDKPVFSELSLFGALDAYIKSLEGEVTLGSIKKFTTLKNSLNEFCASNKKYEFLTFSQIDISFYRAYVKYLQQQPPRGRQMRRPEAEGQQVGLLNDTIGKYIECLKSFLKWAEEENYNKNRAYTQFKSVSTGNKKRKAEKRDIVTLNFPELTKFYNHDFSKHEALERVRDVFCFGCFTGQRWSDIERFEKSQLTGDVWTFTAFKTKKVQKIALRGFSATALDILKKYNYKLPVISNQKFNEMLKKAAEEAGIDKHTRQRRYSGVKEIITEGPKYYFLSSHAARRTNVSILLNVFNMAPSLVMKRTGHVDLKTLQRYLDEDETALAEAMDKTTPVTQIMTVTHTNKKEAI